MSRPPKSFLLQVVFAGGGPPIVKNYYEGGTVIKNSETLPVIVGDRVAWFVQAILLNFSRTTPPFEVSFDKSSFFGVSSVSAPHGGATEFLTVRSPQDKVKYTLSATGFDQVLDPVVQSGDGSGGAIILGAEAITSYTVTWNIAGNSITVKKGDCALAFPLTLQESDMVTFVAVPPADPDTFTVAFQPMDPLNPTAYASPFDINDPKLSVPATPVPVSDGSDMGNAFTFTATAFLAGDKKTSLSYEIDMA